jgi:hypothetical protein
MVQIDGPKQQVYIKFRDDSRMQDVLHSTRRQVEYRHTNGEISMVRIETAGLGCRGVRIPKLPRNCQMEYYGQTCPGTEKSKRSRRSHAYNYTVANDIRVAMTSLAKHIPSHITVAGNRVPVFYDGQPMVCYGCHENGHLYHVCPMRRRVRETLHTAATTSWADIAAGGTGKTRIENEDTDGTALQYGQAGPPD